ncbi:MAG: TIGR03936 family radical SAM-associated protein [Halanaerobiales bacterium]
MIIRAEFNKLKPIRYISHLELMNIFRRTFRRAGLPLAFSRGFNPHIILSPGYPLKVGMVGRQEYFDLELAEEMDPCVFVEEVNKKFPEGINILKARTIPPDIKSLMAVINTAIYSYKMDFCDESINQQGIIEEFLSKDKIEIIRHRRKKKDRILDIRPLIYGGWLEESSRWNFKIRCGSSGNVRPTEVLRALVGRFPAVKSIPLINIERKGLFVEIKGDFYNPLDDKVIGS